MALSREQSIAQYGTERYTGWGETEAAANAKELGITGNSGGSSSSETGFDIPQFSFNWDDATKQALDELTPYYTKLLTMYKGDIALAKQHMDQDYERGLRVQSDKVTTGIADTEAARAERKRKLDLALKDIDQNMNSRGLLNSGIKTGEVSKTLADEAYQQKQLDNTERDLNKGLEYYKEDVNATRDKQLEQWGMKKPSTTPVTGDFAPSNAGVDTTGYNVSDFVSDPVQKQAELEKQKQLDAQTKAENAYNKAVTLWQTQVKQLTG